MPPTHHHPYPSAVAVAVWPWPVEPPLAEGGGYRVTLRGSFKLCDLLRRGHFLPNGDLPLTVTLQEPFRDREKPLRRGRAKPFNHRPTSIQAWQYDKEVPALAHWSGMPIAHA